MLRTIMIASAAASLLGISAASAAPVNASAITAAFYENGAVQQVWGGRIPPSSPVFLPPSSSPLVVAHSGSVAGAASFGPATQNLAGMAGQV